MQAQFETLHIGAWPYQADFNSDTLPFESASVNTAAARLYAVNSGATTIFASIGYVAVISGSGIDVASLNTATPYDEMPMLYHSINTTHAHGIAGYNVDGEQSWGVLKQVEDAWPYQIPKIEGTFVRKKVMGIEELRASARGYDVTTRNSTAPLP